MLLHYIYLLFLLFSVLASLSILRLDWPRTFKHFAVFLVTTCAVEIFAFLWSYRLHKTAWWDYGPNNIWLYNAYLVPQYLFYLYFFASNIASRRIKKAAVIAAAVYLLVAITELFYLKKLFIVCDITIITASFMTTLITVAYFSQLMKAKTVVKLGRLPMFWIAAGAFIFSLGSLPCFMLYNYISSRNAVLATSLFWVVGILNCIMYLLYSIAFLCTRKFPTSPS